MNSTVLASIMGVAAEQPMQAASALPTPEQAARYLTLSVSSLARMRIAGSGPVFIRVSPQRVGYRLSDLDKYLEDRVRTSTSQN